MDLTRSPSISRGRAVFGLLTPSLGLCALCGANRRSWWIALAVLVAMSVPFQGLWVAWVASLVNSRGGGLLYSALEIPMLLIPLVAWWGRRARFSPSEDPRTPGGGGSRT